MNVAVVGSRTFRDYRFLCEKLDALRFLWGNFTIVSGGAQGADSLAVRWAKERGMPEPIVIPAAWDDLSHPDAVIKTRRDGKRYDARAGFRRNQQIIDHCDVVVAFWDGRSPGTRDTLRKATFSGKLAKIYWPNYIK
jgi:hypothetical protein